MHEISRRQFIELSAAGVATLGAALPSAIAADTKPGSTGAMVFLQNDNLNLSPSELAGELARLCASRNVAADTYGLGGVLEEVEAYFARLLGKERALFMPTGTLANQLALRALAGERRRVVVQEASHVYNDCGDASQILSGLTLLPVAPERASFNWADVERLLAKTASGRVAAEIGVISIESPVRRLSGELFDRSEMGKICSAARKRNIATHLDGARLFIACAYTGVSPADYAAPFDTVYISLWKTFNSLNGAILAGPEALLKDMFHARRMFGGALFNAWPFALLARHYAQGYVDRLSAAIGVSDDFFRALSGGNIKIERVPNGSNVFRLIVAEPRADTLRERLLAQEVMLPGYTRTPGGAMFVLQVNETWSRTTGRELAQKFQNALTW
jgi:threonine aldolase